MRATPVVNLVIILLSVLLQAAAVILAVRVHRIAAGRPVAWVVLSSALVLMAGRRIYALVELLEAGLPTHLLPDEVVGLLISGLMLVGILQIQDLFKAKALRAGRIEEARARAREEANKLAAVLAASPVPLWITEDARADVIRGNPAAEALLRIPPGLNHSQSGQQAPSHFSLVQGGRILAPDEMPMQRAARSGEVVRDEALDLVFRDGSVRNLLFQATPFGRGLDGAGGGAVCCALDVTDLQEARRVIEANARVTRQHAARLEALVRLNQKEQASLKEVLDFGLDEAVALTGSRLGYIYFYDEAKREFTLYSCSGEVKEACRILEKQTVYHLDKAGLWGEVVRQRAPILVNDLPAPHPLKKGYPDGHAPLHRFMSVPLFRGSEIVAVVGVGNKEAPYSPEDVEQLNLFMIGLWNLVERRQAEERLARAQKMESLGLMAGGVAHDFNNIFQALVANLELARASLPEEAKGQVYLQRLQGGVERASRLSRDILHASGGDLRRPELTDLTLLVEASIRHSGLEVPLEGATDLPRLLVDPLLLSRVVESLLTNAKEAAGGSGVIRVRTYLRQLQPVDTGSGHWTEPLVPGAYAVLEVVDQGHGIPLESLPRIFDPFFTTREVGRGLGLAAALGIVRGHRGGIQVESIPGVGSVFRVHLPLPEAERAEPPALPEDEEPRVSFRVLLADDEADLREVMAEMMESWFGLQVTSTADGQEALDLLAQRPEAFDLVILDATMPRMGGIEAFQAMRTLRPDLPGILCSGYALPNSRELALAQGFSEFLKKPFSGAELEELLGRVMSAGPRP